MCSTLAGHEDLYAGNKVVLTGGDVGGLTCDGPSKTDVHDNQYFTPTGDITECKQPLAKWQAAGNDKGSSVAKIPSDETIIGWAKALLDF